VGPVSGAAERIEALRRFGAGLTEGAPRVAELARRGADFVARTFGDAAAVWEIRAGRPLPLARAGRPEDLERLATLLPTGQLPSEPAAWQGQAVNGDGRGILLPLPVGGRVVGVLGAHRGPGAEPYDADERAFLGAVADRLGEAAEAAELRSALSLSHSRTRRLLQRSVDGVLVLDCDGITRFVGGSVAALIGWEPEDLLGTSALDIVHPDDVAAKRRTLADALLRPGPQPPIDVRVRRADGTWSWVEDRITNLLDDREVGGLLVNFHDVTERYEAQEALRLSEARYRSIADTAQEGIWVIDPGGHTVYANQKLAELVDRPLDQLYRMSSVDLLPDEVRAGHLDRLARRERTGHEMYELPFVRGDGETRVAQVSASPLFDGDGAYLGALGVLTDITDRRRAEEQLERQALYDGLTGLANRALLTDRLAQALADRDESGPGVVVVFLDLDHFKIVNDTYGHAVGDLLLVQVAERLRSVVRAADTVARFGGDEFVVVCPGLDERGANALAARALTALAAPFDLDGVEVQLSASLGIAHATAGHDTESVMSAADAAMLEAKRRGRGSQVTFDSAVAQRAGERLQETADLRRGLAAGEFVLAYQPERDLTTDRLVGVEALVRWQHPTRGTVYPAEFIPVAERTGMIVPLGWFVIAAACRQAAGWARNHAAPPRVSVNLSARQFGDERLVDLLRARMDAEGLASGLLRLELTEATVMADIDHSVRVLAALRALGVGLSLDDFGTGQSSLAHLARLPLDELKIDRQFVAGVALGGEDLEVVRAAIAMGHALQLQVVAEGVERADTAGTLRDLRCDVGQGFLFGRPVPPEDIAGLLQPA
jgi:diguanylate cyclase (GGDEF)-like protein/PAS domain S-box-containing protein